MREVYNRWLSRVREMLPQESETRRVNLVNLLVGIFLVEVCI